MSHHLEAEHISQEMQDCITNCSDCHDICLETLTHCLSMGGDHAGLDHQRALFDCAQACDQSRDFMLRGSDLHPQACGLCAEACDRCAESCESVGDGDEQMQRCAKQCRECAESCRAMAA